MSEFVAVVVDHEAPADGHVFRDLLADWTEAVLDELAESVLGMSATQTLGPKSGLWSTLWTTSLRRGRRTGKTFPWTSDNYQKFLQSGTEMPEDVCLILSGRDSDGYPELPKIEIRTHRYMDSPDWVTLTAQATRKGSAVVAGSALPTQCASLLRRHSERHPPLFGFVADDAQPPRSALESSIGLFDDDTLPRSEEAVRGYSWVMVVNRSIVEIIGGVQHLAATGAFISIDPLPEGRLFLQSTPSLEEYTEVAVERVFSTLSPILPWRRPRFDVHYASRRLVYEE